MARVDDHLQATPERLCFVERHHELVLQEAIRPVDPIPLGHDVERVEELCDVLQLADSMLAAPCDTRLSLNALAVALLIIRLGKISGTSAQRRRHELQRIPLELDG